LSVHLIVATAAETEVLPQNELLYKEIFDNFSECVFVLDVTHDARFRIVWLNPAEEKSTGLCNAEVAGKFIDDVLPEDVAKRVISHYRRCLEVGAVINYIDELNLPAGARYFQTNLIPLRNHAGRIHRLVGCCIDFTDLKRSQEAAFDRQKLESVGVLASGIAHDFNNLLGAILASTELALADSADRFVVDQELQRIRTITIRGAEIVRQLMIYGGKDSPDFEPLDASALIDEMLRLLRVSISKHARLAPELCRDMPAVQANAGQLRQVILNLITNASDAIGERDGIIRVTTQLTRIGGDASSVAGLDLPEGDYLTIEVSDTGCGMTPDILGRIFDPFFTTKFAGRGLGLSVTQSIVRNHGGAIDAFSVPGQGSTFRVLLPFGARKTIPESCHAAARPAPRELQPASRTILVVDDEEMLRSAVSKALRRKGFSVVEAHDGSAAIDLIGRSEANLDAVLLDVTLPGLSSRKVFENAQRACPNAKVILTSAYSKETVDSDFAGLRVEHFIRKPFALADLFSTLQNALSA
jgi:two-component system cell cycle sensor histidine kinase/response regulator CckA